MPLYIIKDGDVEHYCLWSEPVAPHNPKISRRKTSMEIKNRQPLGSWKHGLLQSQDFKLVPAVNCADSFS
jgi:hypothetical protein